MAQAARLSLRMQKELKLLLSDPPPGASLPHLSSDSDLTSIDADIEGPEGTVYAKGVFRIKIQIPERYPFQPPNVTFGTPIYHPNIDNGGRICLDILNLPPKGSWQPSLNISTVLTSIGLLLGEPNPDDGLMCEASREYKYNRQAFDQKARSMTQKYAMAGASGSTSSDPCLQLNSNLSMMEGVKLLNEARDRNEEVKSAQKKFLGMSRKLSLDSSTSVRRRDDDLDTEEMPPPHSFAVGCEGNLSIEGTKDDKDTNTRRKLDPTKLKLPLDTHSYAVRNNDPEGNESDASGLRCEKPGSNARGRKLSLGLKGPLKRMEMNEENIFPVKKLQLSRAVNASADCGITKEFSLSPQSDLQEISSKKNQLSHSTKDSRDLFKSEGVDLYGTEETPKLDMVIVLDSEDSEDEQSQRSRRKGLLGTKRLKNRK